MQVLAILISLLLDVRAHIPNQPSFGSGPVRTSYGLPRAQAIAAFLITTAFLATVIFLAALLIMRFL
jgi:preprotein translocase subunit SecG